MGVVRCPHGHYYDDQRFSTCPHCGVSVSSEIPVSGETGSDKKGKKGSLFGWLDSRKTVAVPSYPSVLEREDHADGATIAMQASVPVMMEDDRKTVSRYSGANGNDYVTGWLVCVEGPEKGRDYRLHHGFNRIGRDYGMDVQMMDDAAITRENHCSVVYDDRSTGFTAVPGHGTLTYVNNGLLTGAVALQDGDELRLGNSAFVFVPFCRKGRIWERKED